MFLCSGWIPLVCVVGKFLCSGWILVWFFRPLSYGQRDAFFDALTTCCATSCKLARAQDTQTRQTHTRDTAKTEETDATETKDTQLLHEALLTCFFVRAAMFVRCFKFYRTNRHPTSKKDLPRHSPKSPSNHVRESRLPDIAIAIFHEYPRNLTCFSTFYHLILTIDPSDSTLYSTSYSRKVCALTPTMFTCAHHHRCIQSFFCCLMFAPFFLHLKFLFQIRWEL